MPTTEETRLLCMMHICITFECMYQLSPAHRIDLNKPLPSESIFPLQMLQAHFENMVFDKYNTPDDCMNVYKVLHKIAITDPKYKSSDFLQSTIIKCIESLLGENPNLESKWWLFISGYKSWIPNGPLKSFIGKWLFEKDRILGMMWTMF